MRFLTSFEMTISYLGLGEVVGWGEAANLPPHKPKDTK
jgi:hypothetical protein